MGNVGQERDLASMYPNEFYYIRTDWKDDIWTQNALSVSAIF